MKSRLTQIAMIGLSAYFGPFGTTVAHADEPIANWKIFDDPFALDGQTTPTGTGLSTDSPIFGDGTDGSARGTIAAGLFGVNGSPQSVTLDIGQRLTVSASAVLVGGWPHSEPGATGGPAIQYRFGVYNDGGQYALNDATGWAGGINQIEYNYLRTASPTRTFPSAANAPILTDAIPFRENTPSFGTINADSLTPYHWTMSLTRNSPDNLQIFSSLTGGKHDITATFTLGDYPTDQFTYTAMGLLFGNLDSLDLGSILGASYAVSTLGDLNGDGELTNADIAPFVQALTAPAGYASAFPALDPDMLGDFDNDQLLTNADIAGFVDALTGGSASAELSNLTVPEPTSLVLLSLGGLLVTRRRRGPIQ